MQAVVQGRSIAVLYLDLDDFKTVNDSLGHGAGDKLLTEMAERLRSCLARPGDTAARLGGDEFAIVLNDITAPEQAGTVAQRIIESLREPFAVSDSLSVAESVVQVHTSIGIAVSDAENHDPSELLSNADVAMYKAKERGKGRYEYFDPEMRAGAVARLELKDALQGAIERGEFTLRYQPIVDLADGSIVGSEALVRWQDRQRGLMTPHKWLGLAEETGLMDPIGRWVVRQACRQVRDWQLQLDNRELRVNVNLSARQLDRAGLADEIRNILFELRLSPRALVVEITEDVFMEDSTRLLDNLQSLRRTGIRLAIDDFGTGYSSLSYLRRFPIDFVKVDKSFVDDIGSTTSAPALARAIIGMTHSLDLPVVAEGIERAEQLEGLRQMGCDLGQGYLFARPLDPDAMRTLLDQGVSFPLARAAPEPRLPRAGSPPATAVLSSAG
jgi:diguanylate cyclase (GGDEF)-like protein